MYRSVHIFPFLNAFERAEEIALEIRNPDKYYNPETDESDEDEPLAVQHLQPGLFQTLRVQPHLSILRLSCSQHRIGFIQFRQLFSSFPCIVELKLEFQRVVDFIEAVIYLLIPYLTLPYITVPKLIQHT